MSVPIRPSRFCVEGLLWGHHSGPWALPQMRDTSGWPPGPPAALLPKAWTALLGDMLVSEDQGRDHVGEAGGDPRAGPNSDTVPTRAVAHSAEGAGC